MRNKKISKLVDPSFRLYFLVGFLFAAVTVRVSIPLAICEAAAMAFLWWYFRHTAQKRREGIRQYIDDVTDDMTTADKAWEANVDSEYKIYKNLSLFLELGYIRMDLDSNVWKDYESKKNNFKGAFEMKSSNGAFGIRIEVQQGNRSPF